MGYHESGPIRAALPEQVISWADSWARFSRDWAVYKETFLDKLCAHVKVILVYRVTRVCRHYMWRYSCVWCWRSRVSEEHQNFQITPRLAAHTSRAAVAGLADPKPVDISRILKAKPRYIHSTQHHKYIAAREKTQEEKCPF